MAVDNKAKRTNSTPRNKKPPKQKKAKNILIYVTIWLIILIASYLILTFFIYPNSYQKFN